MGFGEAFVPFAGDATTTEATAPNGDAARRVAARFASSSREMRGSRGAASDAFCTSPAVALVPARAQIPNPPGNL